MAVPDKIEVIIYDAPVQAAASACACGCGSHQHGPEAGHDHGEDSWQRIPMNLQAQALALTLEKLFPGQVKVEYINVLQDPRGAHLPQTKLLCSLVYPSPLVYIAGQGRFAGSLPVDHIIAAVAELLDESFDS